MIRFGPAGNSDSFYDEGYKRSEEAPAWLAGRGLTAYEYSFGRGIKLGEDTARRIGREAEACGVLVSGHAPYYINLADPDPMKREESINYIVETARRVKWMGGERVVVHVGAQQKRERGEASPRIESGLISIEHMKILSFFRMRFGGLAARENVTQAGVPSA